MLALLHDFKRQIDAGEIVGQVDAELGCDQSGFQRSRQIESDYAAEFGNRRDPQGGIEVAMKFNLWEGFEIDGHLQLRNNDVNYEAAIQEEKADPSLCSDDSLRKKRGRRGVRPRAIGSRLLVDRGRTEARPYKG